jgi:subtilisin-like proprotein convertase family protein
MFVPVALKMTKVTVQLQVQYPKSGDLKVFLYSPEGTRTILLEHDCSVQNVDTTFDDAAPSSWKDFCPVEAGRGLVSGRSAFVQFQ